MNIKHESTVDVPLILEFCKRLNIQEVLDKHLITHGNQVGLSNGQLGIGWLAHILTQNNHCKAPVEGWANKHKMTLQACLGIEISEKDFEDTRLSRFLDKLAEDSVWNDIELSFYKDSFSVLQLNTLAPESFKEIDSIKNGILKTIKLDSTTACGHHEVVENGIMQRGWSKDHRPDLPQLKIMCSVEGNSGYQIASDIVPGNNNDDPLYIPILKRTRNTIDTNNCLMCADSKLSALYIRADIVENNEFYLTPLQLNNINAKKMFNDLVVKIVDGDQEAELIYDVDNKNINKIIGAGFEVQIKQSYTKEKKETDKSGNIKIEWEERMLLVKSFEHAKQELTKFNKRIADLKEEFRNLESKLCKTIEEAEAILFKKIEKIKKENDLADIFAFEVNVELEEKTINRAEKRNGKTRTGSYKLKKYRAKIIKLVEDKDKLSNMRQKIGWRLFVTNASRSILTFCSAYKFYRKTMYVIEIGFHMLKDYLNISPLFVRNQKQILGMTRLLMLALKILTLMTAEIRANIKKEKIVLQGLYAGQPARKHQSPTAQSILEYFSMCDITLIGHKIDGLWNWGITPVTDIARIILRLLKLSENIYDDLPAKIAALNELKVKNS